MTRKKIEPCSECRRNTPPLGETVCRSCQSVSESIDQRRGAQTEFYNNIDRVEDEATRACLEATRACLEALFHLARVEER